MRNSNSYQVCRWQSSLAELYAQVSQSGKMTPSDRYGLRAGLLDNSLSEEEQHSIDQN